MVTGANGFVGRALCLTLAHHGYEVKAVVRQAGAMMKSPANIKEIVVTDYSKPAIWKGILEDVTCVIHLAARAHVIYDETKDPLNEYRRINVGFTESLLKAAIEFNIHRFVFLSSIKVNGESTSGTPFNEEHPPAPLDAYGISKMEAENLVKDLSSKSNTEYVIIRPPLVYGAGVKANFLTLVKLVRKSFPLPFASVSNARSLIALENLVDFIHICAIHKNASNETFLIADGDDVSTQELVRRIARAMNKKALLFPCPVLAIKVLARLSGRQHIAQRVLGSLQINNSKAVKQLGWKPVVCMQQALHATVDNKTL